MNEDKAIKNASLLIQFFSLGVVVVLFITPLRATADQIYLGAGFHSHYFSWGKKNIAAFEVPADYNNIYATSFTSTPLIAGMEFDWQADRGFAIELQYHSMNDEKTNYNAIPGGSWSDTGKSIATESSTQVSLLVIEGQLRGRFLIDKQLMLIFGMTTLDVERSRRYTNASTEGVGSSRREDHSDNGFHLGFGIEGDINEANAWRVSFRSAEWRNALGVDGDISDIIVGVSYVHRLGIKKKPAISSGYEG